jgi:hypothetical protein
VPVKGESLFICPDCGMKGAYYAMGRGRLAEDCWKCRYCDWWCFGTGHDRLDVIERRKLAAANPDRDIWVTDPELANIYLEDDDADEQ